MKSILFPLIFIGNLAQAQDLSYKCKVSDLTSGVHVELLLSTKSGVVSQSYVVSSQKYRVDAELFSQNIQVIIRDRNNDIIAASAAPEGAKQLQSYLSGAANVNCAIN